MKVTDTHDTAAGHFDYLEAETARATEPVDSGSHPAQGDPKLVDLVEATDPTTPVPEGLGTDTGKLGTGTEPLPARIA